MFKELFPIVERAPLMLMITKDGDRLRVHITQKKSEDDDFTPLNLAIAATPEELDAELPMAIAEGAAMLSDEKPKTITEQVKGQVEQAKEAETEGDKKPSKVKKKAAAVPKKAAAPTKAKKPAAPAKAAKATKAKAGKKPSRSQATRDAYRKKREGQQPAAVTPQITPLIHVTPEDLDQAAARDRDGRAPPTVEDVAPVLGVSAEKLREDLAAAPDYKAASPAAPAAAPKTDGDSVDLFGGT